MKAKNFLAAVLAGTVFAFAPATGIGSQIAPSLGLHGPSIVYAAKGGVRIAPSAPKAAPAAPKATSPDTHKSVSGNGGSYAPSKSAKDLEKTAPAANSANAKAGTAAGTQSQSGSRLGSIMRGVGLLAGGMFLGSMLSHLFGFGTGMMSDMLGLLMNILLFAVAFMVIRALLRRFLGGSRSSRNDYQQHWQAPLQTHAQSQRRPDVIDIQPSESRSTHEHAAGGSVNGSDARSIADKYRNM